MINVLEIRGKHESVDYVILHQFETVEEAQNFVDETNSHAEEKYYQAAEIIVPEREYEVYGSNGSHPAEIF